MKTKLMIIALLAFSAVQAQEPMKPIPQITVSGEGKVKVAPDQAFISIAIENRGTNAIEIKKQNDIATEKVVQFLKKSKVPQQDIQTKSVNLNPQYDYDKKKTNFVANQTIEILLKDLSLYNALMEGLTDAGTNRINSVEFRTSKLASIESEARKLAMTEAKLKAEDFVSVVGQKVGKAYMISDNSQVYRPQPMMYSMRAKSEDAMAEPRETLALGEIEVTANVTVSFILN